MRDRVKEQERIILNEPKTEDDPLDAPSLPDDQADSSNDVSTSNLIPPAPVVPVATTAPSAASISNALNVAISGSKPVSVNPQDRDAAIKNYHKSLSFVFSKLPKSSSFTTKVANLKFLVNECSDPTTAERFIGLLNILNQKAFGNCFPLTIGYNRFCREAVEEYYSIIDHPISGSDIEKQKDNIQVIFNRTAKISSYDDINRISLIKHVWDTKRIATSLSESIKDLKKCGLDPQNQVHIYLSQKYLGRDLKSNGGRP